MENVTKSKLNFIDKRIQGMKDTLGLMVSGWNITKSYVKENGGLLSLLTLAYRDLFVGRSLFEWVYLLALSSVPILIELFYNGGISDWVGLTGSLTGILCVILVAEGRASNYILGLINSLIYLVLTLQNGFYGEVLTTLYFTIMQPIGLLVWVHSTKEDKVEEQEFVAKKLNFFGWVKYLAITVAWWLAFGFIYQSIGSARPFRDSITDGTNGVGQLLMTGVYREQWVFWSATNIFSIYLWWGSSLQMQGMYWVFLLNSLVGWYRWSKQAKKA